MSIQRRLDPRALSQPAIHILEAEAAAIGSKFGGSPSDILACLDRLVATFPFDAAGPEDGFVDRLCLPPFRALSDAARVLGGPKAVELFSREDLKLIDLRVGAAQQLVDPDVPAYALKELASHVRDFCDFQREHSGFIIQTGLPPRHFKQCPWLHAHLGRSYDTRATRSPYCPHQFGSTEESLPPYEWSPACDQVAFSLSEIEVRSYEEAGMLGGLHIRDAEGLEYGREQWFETRLRILALLADATQMTSPASLTRECLNEITSAYTPEDVAFLHRMDQWYFGGQIRLGSGEALDHKMAPGGLANLLEVLGRFQMELSLLTFTGLRQWLAIAWPDFDNEGPLIPRELLYFKMIERCGWVEANREIDEWQARIRRENAAWQSFDEDVMRQLLANCQPPVDVRVHLGHTDVLSMPQHHAEDCQTRIETGTTLQALDLSRPTFRRDGDSWTIVFDENWTPRPDSEGLRHIEFLLRNPGQSFTGLDLCTIRRVHRAPNTVKLMDLVEDLQGMSLDADSTQREDKDQLDRFIKCIKELEQRVKAGEDSTGSLAEDLKDVKDYFRETFGTSPEYLVISGKKTLIERTFIRRTKKDRDSARNAINRAIEGLVKLPSLMAHLHKSLKVGPEFSYAPTTPVNWDF